MNNPRESIRRDKALLSVALVAALGTILALGVARVNSQSPVDIQAAARNLVAARHNLASGEVKVAHSARMESQKRAVTAFKLIDNRDLQMGVTRMVTVNLDGQPSKGGALFVNLYGVSADGRYALLTSEAQDLVEMAGSSSSPVTRTIWSKTITSAMIARSSYSCYRPGQYFNEVELWSFRDGAKSVAPTGGRMKISIVFQEIIHGPFGNDLLAS